MDRAASVVVVCLVIWATAHSVKGEDSVTGHRNYCIPVVEEAIGVASIPYASCIQMRSRFKTQPRPNYYPCLTGLKLVSVRVLLHRREPSNKPVPESRPGGLYPLSSMLTQGRRALLARKLQWLFTMVERSRCIVGGVRAHASRSFGRKGASAAKGSGKATGDHGTGNEGISGVLGRDPGGH
jgi:hypothetical protein